MWTMRWSWNNYSYEVWEVLSMTRYVPMEVTRSDFLKYYVRSMPSDDLCNHQVHTVRYKTLHLCECLSDYSVASDSERQTRQYPILQYSVYFPQSWSAWLLDLCAAATRPWKCPLIPVWNLRESGRSHWRPPKTLTFSRANIITRPKKI